MPNDDGWWLDEREREGEDEMETATTTTTSTALEATDDKCPACSILYAVYACCTTQLVGVDCNIDARWRRRSERRRRRRRLLKKRTEEKKRKNRLPLFHHNIRLMMVVMGSGGRRRRQMKKGEEEEDISGAPVSQLEPSKLHLWQWVLSWGSAFPCVFFGGGGNGGNVCVRARLHGSAVWAHVTVAAAAAAAVVADERPTHAVFFFLFGSVGFAAAAAAVWFCSVLFWSRCQWRPVSTTATSSPHLTLSWDGPYSLRCEQVSIWNCEGCRCCLSFKTAAVCLTSAGVAHTVCVCSVRAPKRENEREWSARKK